MLERINIWVMLFLLIPAIVCAQIITDVTVNTIVDKPDIRVNLIDTDTIHAFEDFTATSDNADMNVCLYSNQEDTITVTNIGNTFSQYSITLDGSAARYVTSVPGAFALMPGKSTKITNYFHLPKKGSYNLIVRISTQQGVVKELRQNVNSQLCNNNQLIVYNFNQSACPCVEMTYNFTVRNTGNYVESYTFGVDKFADYTNVSANPLVLAPGETADMQIYFNTECGTYGEHIVNLFSNAQVSRITSKVPLLLDINKCYGYGIETGQIIKNDDDKFNKAFSAYSGRYIVCSGDNRSIPIRLDNSGYIGNNFFYSFDGPDWGSLYDDVDQLSGGETGKNFLDITPPKDIVGEFKFILNAETQLGTERRQKEVDVNVKECYGMIVELPKEETLCGCDYTEYLFSVYNTGDFDEAVNLELEGPEFINLTSNTVFVKAGEKADVKLKALTECGNKGSFDVKVRAWTNHTYAEDKMTLNLVSLGKCLDSSIKSPSSIRMYKDKIIPIKVTNKGVKRIDYSISLSGPEWVDHDGDDFSLMPGEQYSFNLLALPISNAVNLSSGDYYGQLNITAGDIVNQENIVFKVREGPSLFESMWSWIVYYRWWIISIIIIAIILFLLLLYIKERARVWKIRRMIKQSQKETKKKSEKKSAAKNNKQASKDKNKLRLEWLYILLSLIVLAALIYFFFDITIEVLLYVLSFILTYIWYIALGFLILLVIIFFLNKAEKK